MAPPQLNIADIVFQRANREDLESFAVDQRMLALWMEMDGTQSLDMVADKLGVGIEAIKPAVRELLRLGLIRPIAGKKSPVLDEDFIETLNREYSLAVGPIGSVLIEQEALSLGYAITQFPVHRVAELIDVLANDIQRETKSVAFKKNMISKIREKGY